MSSTTSTSTTKPSGFSGEGLNALKPRVTYVSYHVSNVDRAVAFYVGVLGMREQLRLDLGKGIHEVVLGFPESPGAGLILMWNTERTQPYLMGDGYSRLVVRVSDCDKAVEHVAKHGVIVATPPTDAGTFRYAMIKDPDSYVVELLQIRRG